MEIINNLDGDLQPIADLVGTLLSQEVETLSVDGNLQLVRRLGLGSEAYAVTLFKGVEDSTIDRYGQCPANCVRAGSVPLIIVCDAGDQRSAFSRSSNNTAN